LFSNNLSGPCFAAASVVMVTNGLAHTCALIADGTARCWGLNSNGQLGDGTTTQRLSPVVVKNSTNTGPLTGITQIVAGGTHTCARLSDGTARCWGKNANGQLGDGTTTQQLLPVVVKNPAGSGSLTNVSQLSLAVIYSCARIGDGTARCWGNNNNGVLGDGTQTQRLLPVTVKNPAGTAALTSVAQISVRGIHSCARISDGTARCWGYNPNGQLGDGTTTTRLLPVVVKNPAGSGSLTNVSQIAAGRLHTCARISDGTVRCWGANANGQLGDGTTTQRLLPVIVKNSTNTGSLTAVASIVPGGIHTCALLTDGTARCWGFNGNGQIGDGTTTQRLLPVVVKNEAGSGSLTGVTQLSAQEVHTCARSTDAAVRCWGKNTNGELGDGTTTNHPLPVYVPMS
jgi:alpha-tubulin suppressor-like RCC1 family protein